MKCEVYSRLQDLPCVPSLTHKAGAGMPNLKRPLLALILLLSCITATAIDMPAQLVPDAEWSLPQ